MSSPRSSICISFGIVVLKRVRSTDLQTMLRAMRDESHAFRRSRVASHYNMKSASHSESIPRPAQLGQEGRFRIGSLILHRGTIAAGTGNIMRYDFLIDSYTTERLKVLSVWSEFRDGDLPVRPKQDDSRGRSVHEQMVHQCVSEDNWFRNMLGIDVG